MTQYRKTVEIPARTESVHDRTVCDLCGRGSSGEPDHHGGADWAREGYEVDKVAVGRRVGDVYPECGDGEDRRFDICPDCFETRLAPWLESQGASMIVTEWDY